MTSSETPELVVIGGGIAGGAFATVMARAGHSVLMLEITEQHRDVVRGEWMAPWGVMEAKRLGLYDLYRSHGAHHLKRHVTYDEDVAPQDANARTLEFANLMPGTEGPMTIGHPRLCGILDDAAVAAGAKFLRGVRKTTAHQAGIKLDADPAHHWFSGMLVEGAHGWPDDKQVIGTAGGINFLVFPQGDGRARLYLGAALNDKERFMGEDAPQRFAEAFRLDCVPQSEALAAAKPASHCFVYPNNDTWADEPFAPGVVAIGDAAGHNDPIIGQGLSISHRDVRIVSDILRATPDWSPAALLDYAVERRERMRRLRLAARFASVRDCEFDAAGRARRARLHELSMTNPMVTALLLAPIAGPEAFPADAFDAQALDAILA